MPATVKWKELHVKSKKPFAREYHASHICNLPRSDHPDKKIDPHLVIFWGGGHRIRSDIWAIHPRDAHWKELSFEFVPTLLDANGDWDEIIPTAAGASCIDAVNNNVYIYGGIYPAEDEDHKGDQAQRALSPYLVKFDMTALTSTIISNILENDDNQNPSYRAQATLTYIPPHPPTRPNPCLYLLGGLEQSGLPTNDVHIFDLVDRKWSKPAVEGTPPSPRADHSAVYYPPKNCIYIYGGTSRRGGRPLCREPDMHCLMLDSMKWREVKPLLEAPLPRGLHTAVSYGNKMVIFGGREFPPIDPLPPAPSGAKATGTPEFRSVKPSSEVYVFNLDSERMELVLKQQSLSLKKPEARACHSACMLGTTMYIFGGSTSQSIYSPADRFRNDLWRLDLFPPVPIAGTIDATPYGQREIRVKWSDTVRRSTDESYRVSIRRQVTDGSAVDKWVKVYEGSNKQTVIKSSRDFSITASGTQDVLGEMGRYEVAVLVSNFAGLSSYWQQSTSSSRRIGEEEIDGSTVVVMPPRQTANPPRNINVVIEELPDDARATKEPSLPQYNFNLSWELGEKVEGETVTSHTVEVCCVVTVPFALPPPPSVEAVAEDVTSKSMESLEMKPEILKVQADGGQTVINSNDDDVSKDAKMEDAPLKTEMTADMHQRTTELEDVEMTDATSINMAPADDKNDDMEIISPTVKMHDALELSAIVPPLPSASVDKPSAAIPAEPEKSVVDVDSDAMETGGGMEESTTVSEPGLPPEPEVFTGEWGLILPGAAGNATSISVGSRRLHLMFGHATFPLPQGIKDWPHIDIDVVYKFRIAAVSDAGRGAWSDELSAKSIHISPPVIKAPPKQPTPPPGEEAKIDSTAAGSRASQEKEERDGTQTGDETEAKVKPSKSSQPPQRKSIIPKTVPKGEYRPERRGEDLVKAEKKVDERAERAERRAADEKEKSESPAIQPPPSKPAPPPERSIRAEDYIAWIEIIREVNANFQVPKNAACANWVSGFISRRRLPTIKVKSSKNTKTTGVPTIMKAEFLDEFIKKYGDDFIEVASQGGSAVSKRGSKEGVGKGKQSVEEEDDGEDNNDNPDEGDNPGDQADDKVDQPNTTDTGSQLDKASSLDQPADEIKLDVSEVVKEPTATSITTTTVEVDLAARRITAEVINEMDEVDSLLAEDDDDDDLVTPNNAVQEQPDVDMDRNSTDDLEVIKPNVRVVTGDIHSFNDMDVDDDDATAEYTPSHLLTNTALVSEPEEEEEQIDDEEEVEAAAADDEDEGIDGEPLPIPAPSGPLVQWKKVMKSFYPDWTMLDSSMKAFVKSILIELGINPTQISGDWAVPQSLHEYLNFRLSDKYGSWSDDPITLYEMPQVADASGSSGSKGKGLAAPAKAASAPLSSPASKPPPKAKATSAPRNKAKRKSSESASSGKEIAWTDLLKRKYPGWKNPGASTSEFVSTWVKKNTANPKKANASRGPPQWAIPAGDKQELFIRDFEAKYGRQGGTRPALFPDVNSGEDNDTGNETETGSVAGSVAGKSDVDVLSAVKKQKTEQVVLDATTGIIVSDLLKKDIPAYKELEPPAEITKFQNWVRIWQISHHGRVYKMKRGMTDNRLQYAIALDHTETFIQNVREAWPQMTGDATSVANVGPISAESYQVILDAGAPYQCPMDECADNTRGFRSEKVFREHLLNEHEPLVAE
ncbi:hypothetical protein SmJEL517_g00753 [Synchytrium microbalum]|uniref:Uncharacterized protein n=1 Tax=Synchytrium microbalum TaxID=1806994 RepID=A0A507CEK5_9FUNG|nr:uncharacterized protein SmJEL517_g00753 [Synchytrium microbalum]TPX37619.1 hypothetical protein SmJEL517_g00753 [Synchytrium microbalum]